MTFRSKRGYLLILLLVIDLLAMIAVVFGIVRGRAAVPSSIAVLIGLGFFSGFFIWFALTTDYTIRGHALLIRSGPFHWNIDIRTIDSVRPSTDPTGSPALSLDRLMIVYRQDGIGHEILVSPEDRDGFIAALRAVNSAILSS